MAFITDARGHDHHCRRVSPIGRMERDVLVAG
jgi:hypothetical protein